MAATTKQILARAPSLLFAGLLCASLAGCARDPSAVCLAPETIASLQAPIHDRFQSALSTAVDAERNGLYGDIMKAAANAKLSVSNAVLSSYDTSTKLAKCRGTITLVWPQEIVSKLTAYVPAPPTNVSYDRAIYTAQPTADGKAFEYGVDDETAEGIVRAVQQQLSSTLVQAKDPIITDLMSGTPTNSAAPSTPQR